MIIGSYLIPVKPFFQILKLRYPVVQALLSSGASFAIQWCKLHFAVGKAWLFSGKSSNIKKCTLHCM